MQKVVNAKAKTGLKSNIMVWDLDIYYLRGHYPFNNTVLEIQTQRTIVKNPSPKKSKAKDLNSAPLHINAAKHLKQDKKDKKD